MTAATLTLAKSKTTPDVLTDREALKRYADYLKGQSWCIDVSVDPLKALHADSNYNASTAHFKYEFPSWARANNPRVAEADYPKFMGNLVDRLIPLLPRVVGSAMNPNEASFFERNGISLANTYVAYKPDLPEDFVMPAILEEYLRRIFMNEQDRKCIVQWCADIIQNPGRRCMWAVVMTGEHGNGKSTIFRLVKAALGGRHAWEKGEYGPAFTRFSEVFPNNLLVMFDDAVSTKDTYQRLKHVITCPTLPVELKNVQKVVFRDVLARVFICSNSAAPLKVEEGDRRLYIAEPSRHKVSQQETAEFFVQFNEWFELPDTPALLYHWLSTVDLSDFKPGSTVQTDTHKKMVGLTRTSLETLISDFIENKPIFHVGSLLDYLKINGCNYPNLDFVKAEMHKLGYEQKRRKISGCGTKQIALWQPISARSRMLTSDEIGDIRMSLGNCSEA